MVPTLARLKSTYGWAFGKQIVRYVRLVCNSFVVATLEARKTTPNSPEKINSKMKTMCYME